MISSFISQYQFNIDILPNHASLNLRAKNNHCCSKGTFSYMFLANNVVTKPAESQQHFIHGGVRIVLKHAQWHKIELINLTLYILHNP